MKKKYYIIKVHLVTIIKVVLIHHALNAIHIVFLVTPQIVLIVKMDIQYLKNLDVDKKILNLGFG